MSDAVRHIHTQAQAQAEIERMRAINRTLYACRQQCMREDPQYKARHRATDSQVQKTIRNKKQKAIEDDPFHAHVRKDVDRMAKTRQAMRKTASRLCSGAC